MKKKIKSGTEVENNIVEPQKLELIRAGVSQRVTMGIPSKKYSEVFVKEPNSWDEMIKLPQWQKKQWMKAPKEEMRSLQQQSL